MIRRPRFFPWPRVLLLGITMMVIALITQITGGAPMQVAVALIFAIVFFLLASARYWEDRHM